MISDFKSEIDTGSIQFTSIQYERYLLYRRDPSYDGISSFTPLRVIPFGPLPSPLPQNARVSLEYGKNRDGYWTNEKFLQQLSIAMQIHDYLRPEFQAVFLLDHSSGHRKMPENGLVASHMNKGPGGAQPFMRNGIGQRGAEAVCRERGLHQEGMKLPQMIAILSQQPDFKSQKTIVEELAESCGHAVLFLPKYHCELNFIEMVWAAAKRKTRELCDYTFNGLKKNMPLALDGITVDQCRAYARKSRDYIAAYLKGTHSYDVDKILKEYKSHRRVYLPVNLPARSMTQ